MRLDDDRRGLRVQPTVVRSEAGQGAGRRRIGGDGKVDEEGSLGEASGSCASAAGIGTTSGAVGWRTVRLQPGRYEVLCNLQNHYADGMWEELDVT